MPNAKKIFQIILFFLLASKACNTAFAGPVEVESIQIAPAETKVGTHPEITGIIKVHTIKPPSKILEITVIAVVFRPDHDMKSWTWKNLRMKAGEVRKFTIPKEYVIALAGSYKVDFDVYTKDMLPLHRLSKNFVAIDLSLQPMKMASRKNGAHTATLSSGHNALNDQPSTTMRPYIGIGGFVNTINFSGGPTLIYWPFKNIAVQGSYGVGTFTSYELRGFYRFNTSSKLNLYLGAGYFHAEKNFKVIVSGNNVEGTLMGNSYNVFGGIEVPLAKDHLALYMDVSGTPLIFSKDVTVNSTVEIISMNYSPVTIGIGLVYYLW